jgi:hypothetical protein
MARGTNGSDLTGKLASLLEKVLLPDLRERAARSGVAAPSTRAIRPSVALHVPRSPSTPGAIACSNR